MDGIIIIDKPQDWTSMDVCAKVRGTLHQRRVGHGGTLDPMATGVLPVFVGRATRAVEFAADGDKEYVAALRLGVVTDTQDVTGTVLEERPVRVSRAELEAVLPQFTGDILQVPPMYSAIKKEGKKLYELARKGVEVEREARPVHIYGIELLAGQGDGSSVPAGQQEPSPCPDFSLRVRCSKGTYIRTLCHDIGQALGCGGCMAALRRTKAAAFTLADAVPLADFLAAEDPNALLRPVDTLFSQYGRADLRGKALRLAQNGNPFPCALPDGLRRFYGENGDFLLLGEVKNGQARVVKMFL